MTASRLLPRRAALLVGAVLALSAGSAATEGGTLLASARAEEGWTAEFEAVCARTQDAMTLSNDELQDLIRRCDALKPRIDALDASRSKVYGKRLRLCRDLYAFVLESRKGG